MSLEPNIAPHQSGDLIEMQLQSLSIYLQQLGIAKIKNTEFKAKFFKFPEISTGTINDMRS